jgi:ABC-type transport system involved in multi-copper enzyme maturation permease subunit
VTALLSAELLKLRTTRMVYGLLATVLGIVALADTIAILTTSKHDLATDQEGLFAATVSGLPFVLILGVMVVSGEFRHGTITQTLLVTPKRPRVLVVKLATAALLGLLFAAAAELFALALGVPLLLLRGVDISLDHDATRLVVGTIGAMTIAAMLGAALGSVIRNQVAAIIGAFAWLLVAERVLEGTLPKEAKYAPGLALAAIIGHSEELLSWGAAVAVALGYVAALALVGGIFVFSRDVNSIQS